MKIITKGCHFQDRTSETVDSSTENATATAATPEENEMSLAYSGKCHELMSEYTGK